MRRSSRLACTIRNVFVAILAVGRGPTHAQEPREPVPPEAEASPAEEPSPFEGSLLERAKLSGDWLGARTALDESGITFDLSTTQYYQGVARGGLHEQFQYGGRNDYFLNVDGEKVGLWKGFSVTLHGETRYGESVNTIAGTLLAPNLLLSLPDREGSITALTGVVFTQILSDEFMVYGGKFNTYDDIEQPLTGAGALTGFQNTAMLYNPVFARTVPYSTFGAGVSYTREEETIASLVVYDTNDTPTISGFDTFFDNGATMYAELMIPTKFFELPGHHGLSGTYSTGAYTNLTPSAYLDPILGPIIVTSPKTGSWCLAYSFDQALFVSPDDEEKMWGVFGHLGIADQNPSPVRWFASAGISGASQLADRTGDTFGLACFYMGISDPLKDLAPNLCETSTEPRSTTTSPSRRGARSRPIFR